MFQTFEPVSDRSYAGAHLPPLRSELKRRGLDGFIIPHADEYQNEYLPDYAERLMWASGFSGSAGAAIVFLNEAVIFSDGRYTLQLRQQVDDAYYTYADYTETPLETWLANYKPAMEEERSSWSLKSLFSGQRKKASAPVSLRIGYDPMLHTIKEVEKLRRAAESGSFELVAVEDNPVDAAWSDQPPAPSSAAYAHPEVYSGRSSADKRRAIAEELKRNEVDVFVVTAPPSVAWLLNIRGGDVIRTPLPLSRAIIKAAGAATLFIEPGKVDADLAAFLGADVDVRPEKELADALSKLAASGATIGFDPSSAPAKFLDLVKAAGGEVREMTDPCALPRAQKNARELEGARAAHIRDGAALTQFLHWLDTVAQDGGVDEITAAQKLESFRSRSNELRDLSFDSISGAGPNGAVVHYRVTTQTNRSLQPGELFLIDSGGQYPDGTTDVTRTAPIGAPTDEMRTRFTQVLKGHIALAAMRFPKGVTGHQLDAIARAPLWRAGLDYDHGTGHGVGSFLGVHEGPQRIAKPFNTQPLLPGMILSNEPGYYKSGAFGIRIENLVIVTEAEQRDGEERAMMGFETITLAPIHLGLVKPEMLTEDERSWLNAYHGRVRETLSPHMPDDILDWFNEATRSI